jgi:hypothetical protein
LIPRANRWPHLDRRRISPLGANDGVVDVRPTNRLGLIIVKLAKGGIKERRKKLIN